MASRGKHGDDLIQALGIAIRQQRERLGWSQEDLGAKADFHPVYVSGLERGVRNPSVRAVASIARALGLKTSTLLERAERILE